MDKIEKKIDEINIELRQIRSEIKTMKKEIINTLNDLHSFVVATASGEIKPGDL